VSDVLYGNPELGTGVPDVSLGGNAGSSGPQPSPGAPGSPGPSLGRFGVASPERLRFEREPAPVAGPKMRRQRWPWVVSGVVLAAALCAGGFVIGRATKPLPPPPAPPPPAPATAGVVALTQTVAEGQALSLSDLTVITLVTGSGTPKSSPRPATKLPYFPAAMEAGLVGRHARSALPAGALLLPAELTNASFPAKGQALVGMDLQPSEAPTGGALLPGDQVGVLFVPAASQPPYPPPTRVVTAQVVASAAGQSGDSYVTVLLPAGLAARVAAYAQHNEVALVRLGPGVAWPPKTVTTRPAPTTTVTTRPAPTTTVTTRPAPTTTVPARTVPAKTKSTVPARTKTMSPPTTVARHRAGAGKKAPPAGKRASHR
jgi:hypothetical protein